MVGNGTWRSQYSRVINVDDYYDESILIGIKRNLEYIDSGSVQHKNWIIMEFILIGVSLEHPRSVNFVYIHTYMYIIFDS